MRTVLALICGIGVLTLTSCSKPQQAKTPVGPNDAPSATAETPAPSEEKSADHSGSHSDGPDANATSHSNAKSHRDENKEIAIGNMAPDFAVTIDDKPLKLSELLKDKELASEGVFVLTFWCSFCHSCRDVEHQVDKLAKKYKSRVGVIAVDASAGETTSGVAEFAAKNELTFPIALSPDGEAADAFGVRVTTTTVIIDQEGVVRYCGQFSDRDHQFAEDALKAVLAGEEVHVKKTRHKG